MCHRLMHQCQRRGGGSMTGGEGLLRKAPLRRPRRAPSRAAATTAAAAAMAVDWWRRRKMAAVPLPASSGPGNRRPFLLTTPLRSHNSRTGQRCGSRLPQPFCCHRHISHMSHISHHVSHISHHVSHIIHKAVNAQGVMHRTIPILAPSSDSRTK
jgi:hypothetical protein